jgi:hypothetical protein
MERRRSGSVPVFGFAYGKEDEIVARNYYGEISLGYEHHFSKAHDLERFWTAMALDWHLVDWRRRMDVSGERMRLMDYV